MTERTENKARHVEVTATDLPLHCPMPSMMLWNAHPRVFLPIEKSGEALCPYCGTRYTLRGGPAKGSH
jgi:uncharacterized Zn-finger protein